MSRTTTTRTPRAAGLPKAPQGVLTRPQIELLACITTARDSGNLLAIDSLQLTPIKLDLTVHADLFRDVLILEGDCRKLSQAGYGELLSAAIVVSKKSPRVSLLPKEGKRVKINGSFTFKEDDLSDNQSYDELDISAATASPDTVKALHASARIKKVVLNAEQIAFLSTPVDYSKIIISGEVKAGNANHASHCKHFRYAHFHGLIINDFDITFTHCTFEPNAKITFYLHYPKTEEGAKVAVDPVNLLREYNRNFKAQYKTFFDILSLRDAKKKKEALQFIEQYCITAANEENKKPQNSGKPIQLSLSDAQHFARSPLHKKQSFSHLELSAAFSGLLQDRKSVESVLYKKDKQATLRSLVEEAEKSQQQLKKNGFDVDQTITAEKFIAAIQDKKRYFRGLTVTGDVDLSTLSNKELKKLDIGNVTFTGVVNFTYCAVNGMNAQGAVFEKDALFHDADVCEANFKGATFQGQFSVDQKTLLAKYYRSTGIMRNRYETDSDTTLSKATYVLNHTKKNNPYVITFTYGNANSISKSKLEKVLLLDRELAPEAVPELYKLFKAEYAAIVKNDSFRFARGSMVKRLEKVTRSIAQLKAVAMHAQREPGGRTDRAFQAAIEKFTKQLEAADAAALQQATPQTTLQSDDSAVQPQQPTVVAVPTSVPVSADPLLQYLNADRTAFDPAKIYTNSVQFAADLRAYQSKPDKSPVIDAVLSASVEDAKKILDQALSSFGPGNAYLFGQDDNSDRAKTKREVDKQTVVAAYLLLRLHNAEEKYTVFIERTLYPHYFNFALRPSEKRSGVHKFRYNLAEELFVHAGIENAYRLAVNSAHRHETATSSQLFARKDSPSETFQKNCLTQWGLLPLSTLKDAGLTDAVATRVDASGYDDQQKLCVERILYLSELLKAEKYDVAIQEAKAIQAAYGVALTPAPWGKQNPLCDHLGRIMSEAHDELKKRVIAEAKAILRSYKTGDDALINQGHAIYRDRVKHTETIFSELKMGSMPGRLSDVGTTIMHSLESNNTLKNIAEAVLSGGDFSHQALLKLDPNVFYNYYKMVWVGEDGEHAALCGRLHAAIATEKDPSRLDLLKGVHACVSKLKPVSQLLTIGRLKSPPPATYQREDQRYVSVDDVAVILDPADIALMNRGAVGAEDAIRSIEKALEPIWGYEKVQRAITRNAAGERVFADPKLPATRTLIDDATSNFIKYEIIFMLQVALNAARTRLSHTEVARDTAYHLKIKNVFGEMIQLLSTTVKTIAESKEAGKGFHDLLSKAFVELGQAKGEWMQKSKGLNLDVQFRGVPSRGY